MKPGDETLTEGNENLATDEEGFSGTLVEPAQSDPLGNEMEDNDSALVASRSTPLLRQNLRSPTSKVCFPNVIIGIEFFFFKEK